MIDYLYLMIGRLSIAFLSLMIVFLLRGFHVNGEQIKAARALVGWTAADLAEKSGVSYPTVQRLDATKGQVSGRHETVEAIRKALETQGVQFLKAGQVAAGPGVAVKVAGNADPV
jgi:predicted transcriptional regulator